MSDIVERLRYAHEHSQQRINGSDIFKEAADTIESLQSRAEAAEARLEAATREIERLEGIIIRANKARCETDFDVKRQGTYDTEQEVRENMGRLTPDDVYASSPVVSGETAELCRECKYPVGSGTPGCRTCVVVSGETDTKPVVYAETAGEDTQVSGETAGEDG